MMPEQTREALEALAGRMSDDMVRQVVAYGGLVLQAGRRWNLMSRGALENLDEHLVDSAAVLRAVELEGCSVGDLGSGAGMPGLVLAILRPSCQVTLVDSRRSKVVFLEHAVRALELGNARVVHERLEKLGGLESFDVAVSRALGSILDTLETSLKVVRPGGRLVLYKGPKWSQERAEAERIALGGGATLSGEIPVELPGFARTTTFAVFERGIV